MKKTVRILIPFILALTIILCMVWYLFVYDRSFTRDVLLSLARFSDENGKHGVAEWFYDQAYAQASESDAVAIELAEQYQKDGNYTKAEFTLTNAIADGGGLDLYVALCKTFVQQDKLKDAVNMLNNVSNADIKAQLDRMRPQAPTATPTEGYFNKYINVTIKAASGTIYVTSDGQYPSVADAPYQQPITLTDGENTINALTISENGLVSELATFGYTVGGVIKLVEFSDSAVENAIRAALGVEKDKQLYTNELWSLKSFTVPVEAANLDDLSNLVFLEELTVTAGAKGDLSFISALTNLKNLSISSVAVNQDVLSKIAALPNLEKLTLQNCSLSNISALSSAQKLTDLDLSNNTIKNIEPISHMKSLQNLSLKSNAISDLSPLSGRVTLKQLDISGNAVTSIAPICGLSALTRLDASVNQISSLTDMQTLTSLQYLSVANNGLTDIAKLSACTSIQELHISDNKLTDISALASLGQLMYLNMAHNQVTKLPAFEKNAAIVSIDCSYNKLTNLDALSGLSQINNIYADYNEGIKSINKLSSCPMLVQVNIFGTKVTDVISLTSQGVIVVTTDSPR